MKLHQLVALVKSKKSKYEKEITEIYHQLQKGPLFQGLSRQYKPKSEEGEQLPPENKLLQKRVAPTLKELKDVSLDAWNCVAQHDITNTQAKANIVVDGVTLAENMPVTLLVWLEKRFEHLYTIIDAIPVLDSAEGWIYDENQEVYRTAPAITQRTSKVQKPIVLFPATKEHPAQTQLVTEDIVAGYWETTKLSGAMPLTEKKKLLDKIRKLKEAIILAREEANKTDVVPKQNWAEKLFEYVLG